MVQETKSEKELSVDKLIRKVESIVNNCGNSFTYDLRLCDMQGIELHRIKDANKNIDKQEKMDLLKDSIKESLDIYPNCYSVTGMVGPLTNKNSRSPVREVVNPELAKAKDDEDGDGVVIPPAIVGQAPQKQQPQQNVLNTDYSEMTNDFFKYVGGLFGAPLSGADASPDPKTTFALAVQQFKIKTDMQIEQLNGVVENNKTTMAEQKAKIELYKAQIEKLENENKAKIEKLENEIKKLKDNVDRKQKHIDSLRPKLEEAERLSTKNGQIAQIGAGVLSGVAMNLLANSQFAPLLGFAPGGAQMQQQAPEPQPQQTQAPQYHAEPVDEDTEETKVEQVEED